MLGVMVKQKQKKAKFPFIAFFCSSVALLISLYITLSMALHEDYLWIETLYPIITAFLGVLVLPSFLTPIFRIVWGESVGKICFIPVTLSLFTFLLLYPVSLSISNYRDSSQTTSSSQSF